MTDVEFTRITTGSIPLVIQPKNRSTRLLDWLQENRDLVETKFSESAALLFRGFVTAGEEEFAEIVKYICGKPLPYVYGSTPRTHVGNNVYTATEYPAHQSIPFHNEEAYQDDWPMRLVFFAAQPAEQGGETPIADTLKVTQRIDKPIRDKFFSRKVRYVRNYGMGIDLSWQKTFQTESKAEVESFCRNHGIEFQWKADGCLHTAQICQAMATHPVTGDLIWFNQAHLFHVSSLEPKTRTALLSIYREDELPRNAYYGDGSSIEEETLNQVRKAFSAESVAFPWQLHDVLLLDNMRVSHSRNPFKGKRRILAAMGDLYSSVTKNVISLAAQHS